MLVPNREKRIIKGRVRYGFKDQCYCAINAFLSLSETKNINEAFKDEDWVIDMQEDQVDFKRNKV